MSKAHWSIDLKQVDNGYVLNVSDRTKYESSESVYKTVDDALEAVHKTVGHIEKTFLSLSSGIKEEDIAV